LRERANKNKKNEEEKKATKDDYSEMTNSISLVDNKAAK